MDKSPHVMLIGAGADAFAAQVGLEQVDPSFFFTERRWQSLVKQLKKEGRPIPPRPAGAPQEPVSEVAPMESEDAHKYGTVGVAALDRNGNIAAATSTGGTLNKAPGRLGDSSLIGCGCYANNESAAVSTTGWGEPIMKLVLAKWTADRIQAGNLPEWSAQEAMNYLQQRLNGHGGIIVLNPEGHIGIAHNTPRMAWAYKTLRKQEAGVVRES